MSNVWFEGDRMGTLDQGPIWAGIGGRRLVSGWAEGRG